MWLTQSINHVNIRLTQSINQTFPYRNYNNKEPNKANFHNPTASIQNPALCRPLNSQPMAKSFRSPSLLNSISVSLKITARWKTSRKKTTQSTPKSTTYPGLFHNSSPCWSNCPLWPMQNDFFVLSVYLSFGFINTAIVVYLFSF